MRRSGPRRLRPVSFHGWWKGLPFVALVFAVFFGEAWLRTGIQVNDYRMGETTRQIREVQERIEALQAEESHLKRISRIDSAAPDLGLVSPSPGQIIVIEVNETTRIQDDINYATAVAD